MIKEQSAKVRGYTIYHDLLINASPTKVFQAVSEAQELVNWWPLKCSGQPVVGSEYNFNFTEAYDWYGKVISCIPDQSFHIKMTQSDPDWDHTSFGFDLKAVDGNTKLQFWHKDWPHCNEHFRIASFCWAMLLNGLKNYTEQGNIVPFEQRN